MSSFKMTYFVLVGWSPMPESVVLGIYDSLKVAQEAANEDLNRRMENLSEGSIMRQLFNTQYTIKSCELNKSDHFNPVRNFVSPKYFKDGKYYNDFQKKIPLDDLQTKV